MLYHVAIRIIFAVSNDVTATLCNDLDAKFINNFA